MEVAVAAAADEAMVEVVEDAAVETETVVIASDQTADLDLTKDGQP